MPTHPEFSARSLAWRLHSGEDAIGQHLHAEAKRAGARRAFIVTSPSTASKTDTVRRVERALGDLHAGTFAGIANDSTYASVKAATEAARSAGADMLVAVGGGSVIVAARAVNIFLCEAGDPFEIMTQYPDGGRAFSPRLDAPKLPTVNIVTTPTSSMNRAGTGLKNDDLDHRMEYFDPKTRPTAIFWDWQALAATPYSLVRSTATTTFAGAFSGILRDSGNPLVDGDRQQAFRSAHRAYSSLPNDHDGVESRLDLCAAAFLFNRAEDDSGGSMLGERGHGAFSGNYAVSTALHIRYPHVGQGESTSVLTATVMRRAETPPHDMAIRAAEALGVSKAKMTANDAVHAVADEYERLYQLLEMPTRVSELGIPRFELELIARDTVKNFNANAGARSEAEQVRGALELLEAAW